VSEDHHAFSLLPLQEAANGIAKNRFFPQMEAFPLIHCSSNSRPRSSVDRIAPPRIQTTGALFQHSFGADGADDRARAASQIWCQTYTTPLSAQQAQQRRLRASDGFPTDRRGVGSVRVLRIHARILRAKAGPQNERPFPRSSEVRKVAPTELSRSLAPVRGWTGAAVGAAFRGADRVRDFTLLWARR
jgi:hypothetical protein